MQANYITCLPRRMGLSLSARIDRGEASAHVQKLLWKIQNDVDCIPLNATGEALKAQILNRAEQAARQSLRYVEELKLGALIVDAIGNLCTKLRVSMPASPLPAEIIARAISPGWWARKIRVEHKRRFEHTAIQLGFTGVRNDPYITRESAFLQAQYNLENQRLLEAVTLINDQTKQEFTVAELADKGTANKAIRRGELMLRIRGFEEIATDLQHVGVFVTITCPSKYHSVGGANEKYNGTNPREAQAYLVQVWARIRAALKRENIRPYGFRIAEPHSDGCPHWHLLLFVPKDSVQPFEAAISRYAMAEDGSEKGAAENRVRLVRIEAGKGTAAGYIAKYVSKNIDGYGVGDHKIFEDGKTYTIKDGDLFGNPELVASQRVTYWSQVWGIRQFQQIGGAPVGVWRELRRIKAETIAKAPQEIRAAWQAAQKIESSEDLVKKQADFAAYIRAQGGVSVGRGYLVRVATRLAIIDGRYGTYEENKPCGVFSVNQENAVYESVRYTWTVKESKETKIKANPKQGAAGGFGVPWTGVNNCTQPDWRGVSAKMDKATKELSHQVGNKKFTASPLIDWPGIVREAREIEKNTNKMALRRNLA